MKEKERMSIRIVVGMCIVFAAALLFVWTGSMILRGLSVRDPIRSEGVLGEGLYHFEIRFAEAIKCEKVQCVIALYSEERDPHNRQEAVGANAMRTSPSDALRGDASRRTRVYAVDPNDGDVLGLTIGVLKEGKIGAWLVQEGPDSLAVYEHRECKADGIAGGYTTAFVNKPKCEWDGNSVTLLLVKSGPTKRTRACYRIVVEKHQVKTHLNRNPPPPAEPHAGHRGIRKIKFPISL